MRTFTSVISIVFCFNFLTAQETQLINKLKSFTKAYGYIKYFHPSDEAAETNWKKYAVYGAKQILDAGEHQNFERTLSDIINPVAPTAIVSHKENVPYNFKNLTPENKASYKVAFWQHQGIGLEMGESKKLYRSVRVNTYEKNKRTDTIFDTRLGFGALLEKDLGNGICFQMPLSLYTDKKGTYPYINKDKTNAFATLINQINPNVNSLETRLGNIIIVFNVFQHFYPYFKEVDVNWNTQLEIALQRCFRDKNMQDHVITLQKMTATLQDAHISVRPKKRYSSAKPSVNWEWIEGNLVLTTVTEPNSKLKMGDVVTKINGVSAKEYFKEVHSRISSGNTGWKDYIGNLASLVDKENSFISIEVDGVTHKLRRTAYSGRSSNYREEYYQINDSVYYLNLSKIHMDQIDKLIPKLKKVKSIICDLRGYPRSNHEFISHLLKSKDTTKGWMKVAKIVYPDQERISGFNDLQWNLPAKKPYLGDKQIIFLTDGSAVSYAESYMGYIKGYKLATIIGQPTAGANGNINSFMLPGDIKIYFTGMYVTQHNGIPFHAKGIQPDIFVEKTIAGLKEERDEFLEKAIELTTLKN